MVCHCVVGYLIVCLRKVQCGLSLCFEEGKCSVSVIVVLRG